MKILSTADIHIGRRSSRLLPTGDDRRHSAAAAWSRIVDRALSEMVDLVLISGDIVDKSNRFLEALGPFERGVTRLFEAEIGVVVVGGNHDSEVLPRLVDAIGSPALRQLGRRGTWERQTVERSGERLHLDGWSFPSPRWRESPLRGYAPELDGAPVLALVHGELEQPASQYGPISLAELRSHPEVFFLLGHIHAPRLVQESGGARFLYPGSPQAMDPGEPGPHGVWLIEIDKGSVQARQIPLSTVRYDALDVQMAGVETVEDAEGRLVTAIRTHLAGISAEAVGLESVRYRVRVTGSTSIQRAIENRLAAYASEIDLPVGSCSGSVESISFMMNPERDLEALSAGIGAPAVLAKMLHESERPAALRDALKKIVREISGSRKYVEVGGDAEDREVLARLAEDETARAASVLLEELLRQKAGS